FRTEPITAVAHRAWFRASLDGARALYVIERDGAPAGVARLDPISEREAEVSLTVAPGYRCRGIGKAALLALAERARERGVTELLARIRADNPHSQATFEHAGYECIAEAEVNGVPALIYRCVTR
ncbi:MAG TPA: GNAT family N-acetyltransferase, partial [Gammaproteobacteria bacterium]|nr:GNAT family N-acetyltransferase [Gammaproteobacteria bacterium]